MKILVLNCGSSSLKYSLVELPNYQNITAGLIERVGTAEAFIKFVPRGSNEKVEKTIPVPNHTEGVRAILDTLCDAEVGYLTSLDELDAVGHRLVHGGETFTTNVRITDEVIEGLRANIPLAPLHNPANIQGIEAVSAVLPNIAQAGAFDTAFHQTMPAHAYLYGLPYELYTKYGIRRYGFHGTSHDYVSAEAAKYLGRELKDLKMITAHIGSGASITAIKEGKSIDTSMGLTPSEGLLMGTRAGDIDSGVVEWLLSKMDYCPELLSGIMGKDKQGECPTCLSVKDVSTLLNKKSGTYGMAGIGSSDMRDLTKAAKEGNQQAQTTIDALVYRLKKYIGAYSAAMGGLDVLVFTAGIGENVPEVRSSACADLGFLGIELDEEKNAPLRGKLAEISTPQSRVRVLVVPTDEEYMIAKATYDILSK